MDKTQNTAAVLASILVLFSALVDPRLSAGIAVAALLGLGIYTFALKRK